MAIFFLYLKIKLIIQADIILLSSLINKNIKSMKPNLIKEFIENTSKHLSKKLTEYLLV